LISQRINLSSAPAAGRSGNLWASGFLRPRVWLRCDSRSLQCVAMAGQSLLRQWDDPLAALAWMSQTWPDPRGRWVGHLNYDLGRLFEAIGPGPADELEIPLFNFTFCSSAADPPPGADARYPSGDVPLRSNFTRPQYERAVAKAIEYIAAGDVFQVNLSQRFTVGLRHDPVNLYHHLARQWPARYGALLSYGDYALISHSPELFLAVTPDRRITTRPIKGTRPLLPGMDEQLRNSLKDQAELNMIVDLERNDLGRVCTIGSVKVIEPRAIEAHPSVYHGVATIEGMLREDVTFVDLLRAMFPGGSVTGAPKIRAMEIIDELEPARRGPYCGAIGYLAADGSMQFNIAIRTMIVKDGLVHIPVGGGIVADSDPAAEYEETLTKAKALFDTLGVLP
jgi:anthranilate/para-aminobenzoate synthase component I